MKECLRCWPDTQKWKCNRTTCSIPSINGGNLNNKLSTQIKQLVDVCAQTATYQNVNITQVTRGKITSDKRFRIEAQTRLMCYNTRHDIYLELCKTTKDRKMSTIVQCRKIAHYSVWFTYEPYRVMASIWSSKYIWVWIQAKCLVTFFVRTAWKYFCDSLWVW